MLFCWTSVCSLVFKVQKSQGNSYICASMEERLCIWAKITFKWHWYLLIMLLYMYWYMCKIRSIGPCLLIISAAVGVYMGATKIQLSGVLWRFHCKPHTGCCFQWCILELFHSGECFCFSFRWWIKLKFASALVTQVSAEMLCKAQILLPAYTYTFKSCQLSERAL